MCDFIWNMPPKRKAPVEFDARKSNKAAMAPIDLVVNTKGYEKFPADVLGACVTVDDVAAVSMTGERSSSRWRGNVPYHQTRASFVTARVVRPAHTSKYAGHV